MWRCHSFCQQKESRCHMQLKQPVSKGSLTCIYHFTVVNLSWRNMAPWVIFETSLVFRHILWIITNHSPQPNLLSFNQSVATTSIPANLQFCNYFTAYLNPFCDPLLCPSVTFSFISTGSNNSVYFFFNTLLLQSTDPSSTYIISLYIFHK